MEKEKIKHETDEHKQSEFSLECIKAVRWVYGENEPMHRTTVN